MSTPIDKLLMLSAMYENGGNTTHRLLDGHPELFVYPFESQLGTKYVNDYLSSMYPLKYRWPIFPNSATIPELYHMIIDEECKVRALTPFVSKFRDADFDFSNTDRAKFFEEELQGKALTRPAIMLAFFAATFRAWKNVQRTGNEACYVGYSPVFCIDGGKMVSEYDGKGFVLHVIRNPFSAYADTKKRAVPLSLEHYMTGWNMCQDVSTRMEKQYPGKFFVRRFEDIIADPVKVLGDVLTAIGLHPNDSLKTISWNGKQMEQVYPWGTVRIPTADANLATAKELSKDEIEQIYARTSDWIARYNYQEFYQKLA